MFIDYFSQLFSENSEKVAFVWRGETFDYKWLSLSIQKWLDYFKEKSLDSGSVVALEANFTPNSIALLMALIEHKAIVVPITEPFSSQKDELYNVSQVEVIIHVDSKDQVSLTKTNRLASHELLVTLKRIEEPGIILFTSGSTGDNKAVLHNANTLLEKYRVPRRSFRTIAFLMFDHIGGLDTLFYNLSNSSSLVLLEDRSTETICQTIEAYKVEVLPVSPTFMNLLLLSGAYKNYDLMSLKIVTYGAEVMPESTLKKFHKSFSNVQLIQKYGTTEVGTLRSKSKSDDSLELKVGGEGFQTRVVDGLLEIKAQSAMLGYLNAPSPFTEDGWFKTGDEVEVEGEYIRILGRRSEVINIGGEKVFPAEVENLLYLMDGVEDVVIRGEKNQIMGQILIADIKLSTNETLPEFRSRMFQFFKDKVPHYKIPQKVIFVNELMHGARFKKNRKVG